MTETVVGAIAPKLERAEIERSQQKPTESLGAYDYFLRGMAAMHQLSGEASDEALSHFTQAIQLEPVSRRPMAWRRAATPCARWRIG